VCPALFQWPISTMAHVVVGVTLYHWPCWPPLPAWPAAPQITFKVTQKASACPPAVTTAAPGTPSAGAATASQQCLAAWRCSAPYLIYYGAVAASLVWVAVHAAMGAYTIWRGALAAAALGWMVLVCLCIWPPVATLLPREETERGWRVRLVYAGTLETHPVSSLVPYALVMIGRGYKTTFLLQWTGRRPEKFGFDDGENSRSYLDSSRNTTYFLQWTCTKSV